MVVGFNHNFSYKGQVYHVQTEDSGVKNPHIITLLYRGGTILASKKTSYADIIKVDQLESVVEDLMKGQHREMLRQLKNGEFDDLLGLPPEAAKGAPPAVVSAPPIPERIPAQSVTAPAPTLAPTPASTQAPSLAPRPTPAPTTPVAAAPTAAPATPPEPIAKVQPATPPVSPAALTLDDIILSYMVGEENKK